MTLNHAYVCVEAYSSPHEHCTENGCTDAIVLGFESEGASDEGLDSNAWLTFCRKHALEFVAQLRTAATAAELIVTSPPLQARAGS